MAATGFSHKQKIPPITAFLGAVQLQGGVPYELIHNLNLPTGFVTISAMDRITREVALLRLDNNTFTPNSVFVTGTNDQVCDIVVTGVLL